MFFNCLYSDLSKRFNGWLETSSEGEFIADLALDYINRSVQALLLEAPRGWDYLTDNRYALTLSGLSAPLPDDCGVLLKVFCEVGSSKPYIYYSNDGSFSDGFRIVNTFSKDSGFSGSTIEFFAPTPSDPMISYQKTIEAFEGTGDEYSPFPAELVILMAQKIRCRENAMLDEWKVLSGDYEATLAQFKAKHQNVVGGVDMSIADAFGSEVVIPAFGLNRGSTARNNRYSNDTDYVRY